MNKIKSIPNVEVLLQELKVKLSEYEDKIDTSDIVKDLDDIHKAIKAEQLKRGANNRKKLTTKTMLLLKLLLNIEDTD